jgi:hypothetical protein
MNNAQQSLLEVFTLIRERPAEFVPDQCISELEAFWNGFTSREDVNYGFRIFSPKGFHEFVNERFRNDTTHGAVSVIALYSNSQAEAWARYFELLDEFNLSSANANAPRSVDQNVNVQFSELLPAILERPAMYVGRTSFNLVGAFISGWLHASDLLKYEQSSYEQKFRAMLRYIEEFDINLPGPSWRSIIWFWTFNDEEAIELLRQYINEFINEGKGNIQRIEYHMDRRLKARGDI